VDKAYVSQWMETVNSGLIKASFKLVNIMKTKILAFAMLLFAFSVQSQDKDNTLSPEEFALGWELLFDGSTLKGWKAYNGDEPQSWKVDENSIYCDGTEGGDDIMTTETFRDFDLKFDWRIEENGNSGVIYMVREGKQWGKPYRTGPEYQIYDHSGEYGNKSVGSLYDVYGTAENKTVNPAMQWNSGRIRVSNGLITHWVNGIIVLQCQLFSDDWNEKVAESKWKDNPYFAKSPFGHIDFQNHRAKIWLKNIKIRKL